MEQNIAFIYLDEVQEPGIEIDRQLFPEIDEIKNYNNINSFLNDHENILKFRLLLIIGRKLSDIVNASNELYSACTSLLALYYENDMQQVPLQDLSHIQAACTLNPLDPLLFQMTLRNGLSMAKVTGPEIGQHFKNIIENTIFGIQITNQRGQIIFCNSAYLQLIHCKNDDIKGKYAWEIVKDENEREEYKKYFQSLFEKPSKPSIYFIKDSIDGKEVITQHAWNYMYDHCKNITGVFSIVSNITEQLEAEYQLAESEERNRVLIEELPEALVVHQNGKILYVNPTVLRKFGGTFDDYLGQSVLKFVHPEYAEIVNNRLLQNDEGARLPDYEIKLLNAENLTLDVEITSIPIKYQKTVSNLLVLKDITKRKEHENALKMERDKAQNYLDISGNIIVVIEKDENISLINKKGLKVLGYSNEKIIGKNWFDTCIPEDIRENIRAGFRELKNFKSSDKQYMYYENEIITKQGERRLIRWSNAVIVDDERQVQSTLSSGEDITEQKQYEKQLIEAKNKAEESDKLKSSFLANMSHEIRTPMNGIIGFSEMLKQPDVDKERQIYFVNIITKSCQQLLTIINDIVDISKIESGQVDVYLEDTSVMPILQELYETYKPLAEAKEIKLTLDNATDTSPLIVATDPLRLKQIINHLLNNALKFTHQGSITMGYEHKNKAIEFYVKDTGIGIAAENQEAIFERFRQVEMDATRNYGGNGLGLSISKALTAKLGGTVWLDSEPGKGSIFYFNIPYRNNYTMNNTTNNPENQNANNEQCILVAEDEEINFLFINEILSGYKTKILRAINGQEAVDMIKENTDINLVLMDIKMPVMDGYEATRLIKQIRDNVPVIAQTAYAMSGDKEKSLEAGCDDYISKPVKKDALMEKINQFITLEPNK